MNTTQDDKNKTVNDELLEGAVVLENMVEATKEATVNLKTELDEAKRKYEAARTGTDADAEAQPVQTVPTL